MLVSNKEIDDHSENYSLERGEIIIEGVQVTIGYEEEFVMDGLKITNAYECLAFDFDYNNVFYSGEIYNTKGQPSKEILRNMLENFIGSIITKVKLSAE